jgi:uncharacterized protein involved in exopolysaccharide biosynthesis
MQFGLLLDSAHAQQKSAAEHLEALKAHTRDLDSIVRDEIRRTLVEELQQLNAEINSALRALKSMGRAASFRAASWSVGLAAAAALIPGALVWWLTPSTAELASLRSQRDMLRANVARLEAQGARVEWRRCGEAQRLCVRVERGAPAYGEAGDYFIVKGQ